MSEPGGAKAAFRKAAPTESSAEVGQLAREKESKMPDDKVANPHSGRLEQTNETQAGILNLLEVACPLCDGKGKLSRTYLYEQLGVRDMAKLATHTAKEAVEEVTSRLWQQYKENLAIQVKAESETLNQEINRLRADHAQLEARTAALQSSIAEREKIARDSQRNEDREHLLAERTELQNQVAELKGQIEQARAQVEAALSRSETDVQLAVARVKNEEALARDELKKRVDEMNEAIASERKHSAQLQTDLERARSEVKQREMETRERTLSEVQKNVVEKSESIAALKEKMAQLQAQLDTFPEKERLAKQAAIQDQEGKLRKLELDRDNLQTERNRLNDELQEARRKLEDSKGKVEERTFEQVVSAIPGVWIEDWSSKKQSGDYHVGLFAKDGEKLPGSKIVVDNKDVKKLTDAEIDKLVRDAKHQGVALAAMVVSDEGALRPKDKVARFQLEGGVTVLRTTREWFPRDLDLLRPLMRRQAEEGPDFLKRNVAVAAEVRSHMKAIDEIERFTRLARENSENAERELKNFRSIIESICSSAGRASQPENDINLSQ